MNIIKCQTEMLIEIESDKQKSCLIIRFNGQIW